MTPQNLSDWLLYQENLHNRPIELGLERVGWVARRLGVCSGGAIIITVAGTNGKGSCVAIMESILDAAGYRVGSYTSPHIMCYNERIRVNRQPLADALICSAFERVNKAREGVSLSYFEFGTLAALHLFRGAELDVMLLEVGLGGRLDAVNICDADLAIITNIALDHIDWLGQDRESIGFEKAGIMRPSVPVICGDSDPPLSVLRQARVLKSPMYSIGREFRYRRQFGHWSWEGPEGDNGWSNLPLPGLEGEVQLQNSCTVLMGLYLIQERLPIDLCAIHAGLIKASIPGRLQRVPGKVETILDIAHNPAAAHVLAATLKKETISGHTHAVFAVLSDKDVGGIVQAMRECVDYWYLTEVQSARAMPFTELAKSTKHQLSGSQVENFPDASKAYRKARLKAQEGDRIVVFGSALIVAPILNLIGTDSTII